ncbi:hypothetical protein C8R43DRAFT_337242 [Mycena crocata]|nr:hypothetical protein C8R43DRAFT_337242 [Mycena crocata]
MALSSTTETKTYILDKYSRSYSPKQPSVSSEWRHFTNPTLRLILDIKLSPVKAESFRLRVVWAMNDGPGSGGLAQNVILEDLDLLAFSSLKENKSDSSPLKAVYRDTTFGLRYLHVSEPAGGGDPQKVFRRFQVSLANPAATLQLVDAIRDVCPCKPPDNRKTLETRKTTVIPPKALLPPPVQRTPMRRSPTQLQRVPTLIIPDAPLPTSSPVLLSSRPEPVTVFPSSPLGPPSDRASMPSPSRLLPSTSQPAPIPSFPPSSPLPCSTDNTLMPPPPPPPPASSSQLALIPSFPDPDSILMLPAASSSSQPAFEPSPISCSTDGTLMPPPLPATPAETNGAALAAALREPTGLYDLSYAALERLVGDVVREDRFVGLVSQSSFCSFPFYYIYFLSFSF